MNTRLARTWLCVSVFTLAACTSATPERPDFRAALDAHLGAIARRNLPALERTLTSEGGLYVIFPNGQPLTSTEEVVAFHGEWFADPNWVMEPEVVKIIEGADMAMALLKYRYRDAPEGAPRSSWLALVFKLEGKQWRLVHDQNTRIDPPAEGA